MKAVLGVRWCDYCDQEVPVTEYTGMALVNREEFDREAGVLYPRYIDVCSGCQPKMVDMGYVAIRPISEDHPSAGRRRSVNYLRVVRTPDEA